MSPEIPPPAATPQSAPAPGGASKYWRKLLDLTFSSQQTNPKTIYIVLIFGFCVLLFLIWFIGNIAQEKINQISARAGETYDDYNRRESVAQSIEAAAGKVIVESKLLIAAKSIRIPVPPFKANYNEAKEELKKKLEDGKRLWGSSALKDSFSEGELNAWHEVESSANRFWESLNQLEATKKNLIGDPAATSSGDGKPAPQTAADVEPGEKTDSKPAPPSVPEDFRDARSNLEKAAVSLAKAVSIVRDKTRADYTLQQESAATTVTNASWMTLLLGILVAAITIALAQNQIVWLRRSTRRAVEAEGIERSVTDSQGNLIVVINEKGELIRANKAFYETSQTTHEELSLQDYRAVFAHMPEVTAFIWNTLQQKDSAAEYRERIEVKPRSLLKGALKRAETRLFDVRITPLRIEGEPNGRVVVIDDITEAEKQREENRRNRTLSAVGTITAQVAHELYNPIGAVKLNLELIEMQIKEDEDVKHTVGRLKRGVEHLSTIVMDLRYLTKPRDPERKSVDINKLLDEVIELANDRLERTRILIVRDYSTTVPEGSFDQQQLRKVFLNLLINAVEATPQNGEIKLRTRFLPKTGNESDPSFESSRGSLAVSIIDHGAGMSPETKRRLFEAFYTTKRNGTGLGMMITQEIIKKHNGNIEVESEEGSGTTVNVYLPV
jgi:signal transduction histidine kinase